MLSRIFLALSGILILVFLAVSLETAEAKRFGGGRSFGSKPSMSQSVAPPAAGIKQPGAAAQAPGMQRQGMFGGMGGMLGGLLAGGLIGSMLFGGMGGLGGGFLDIILIGGLVYLAFKFLSRRRAASSQSGMRGQQPATATATAGGNVHQYQERPSPNGMGWDALSSAPAGAALAGSPSHAVSSRPPLPEGFDENEFLEGAKVAYTRLNTAWDSRDLSDIERFATQTFMNEIRAQAQEDPTPSRTEILLVNASLTEVRTEGDEQMATVYFDVVLREDPSQPSPTDVREMWHFIRNKDGSGQWRLDGIQQVS